MGTNTPEGFKPSTPNALYRVSEVDYDIVHIQHKPVAERVLSMYPELDKICTIHSEVMSKDLENPVINETIKNTLQLDLKLKNTL